MLTRVCRSPWQLLSRPLVVSLRFMCSDSDSTIISHRRTYLKRETKDDIKPIAKHNDPLWTTMTSTDLLLETIIAAKTLDDLLAVIDRHHSSFRQKHIKAAFHFLKVLGKTANESQVADLPQFRLLCRATMKLVRTFSAKELLTILGRLVDFKVSPEALIFLSIVQMLRRDINDLHADSLLLLDSLLNTDMDKSHPADSDPTIGALRIALPMLLEIRLVNNEFVGTDFSIVIPALRVAVSRNLSAELVNKLMRLAHNQKESLTFYQHVKLVTILTHSRVAEDVDIDSALAKELLSHCLHNFTQRVKNSESTRTSEDLVIDLFYKSFDGKKRFYSEEFFDLVCQVHFRKNMKTSKLVKLAKHLLAHDYVNLELVTRITDNLAHERLGADFGAECAIGALHPLVTLSDFEPDCGWRQIIQNLFDNDLMEDTAVKQAFQYLKNLESMALVGYYDEQFYSNLTHALTAMCTRRVPLGIVGQRLINIYLGLRYDDHGLPQEQVISMQKQLEPLVQEAIRALNPIRKEFTQSSSSLLRDSLIKALGGEDFLRTGIWSESGHYHDYVVVMRKGDFPVAIGKEILGLDFLENIKLPDECKLLSIVPLTDEDFLRHPPQMRRLTRYRIDMLRKSGFRVLPIRMSSFEEMPKRELIPFLMREVTDAIRDEN